MRNATQKEIDNFIEYRANHVALVQRIGSVVFGIDISDHDKDKIEANGEELNLFSLRNSMLNGTYHPHKADKAKLKKLVGKHIKSQKHHPEYWDDSITARNFDDENPPQVNAHKMPKRYLLEMVCDWCAVALKLNKPLFNWYNKTCTGENARFLFTDNQKEYIIECISRVASKIKEENLHYPKIEYTAELDSPKIDFGKKLKESKEGIIYSKEFKDWFGDWENDPEHSSKVVDKDGKPLAVYHGSYNEFDTFKSKGMGIHFGTKQASEDRLSNTADIDGEGLNYENLLNKRKEYAREKGIIYPCFLNIRNPFILKDFGNSNFISSDIYEYLIDYGFPKEEIDGLLYKDGVYLKEYLISKKFDGIFYKNKIEDEGSISYIVFNSNQIKSATDNNGNFSRESDNIYEKIKSENKLKESKEDIIYSKEFKDWFGDWENDPEHSSKVVDKDGKPLAVYHGSPNGKFDILKFSYEEGGIYFSDNKSVSESYFINYDDPSVNPKYSLPWDIEYENLVPSNEIYECYLNIRNPLVIDAKNKHWNEVPFNTGYSYPTPFGYTKVSEDSSTSQIAVYAKKNNYDGVIIKNIKDGADKKALSISSTTYIVFNSNQIKSATDNNGNFSKESDNMYESRSLLDMSTEEVINLVEEPVIYRKSFKEWFGDWENDPKNSSKMIGRNGKPKVFYHGTNKKFDTFSTDMIGSNTGELGWYGKGFYFTTDYLMARHYGSKVLEVYLNIRHPFYIDSNNLRRYKDELELTDLDLYMTDPARIFKNNKKSVKLSELLIKDGYDGIIYSEDGVSWSEVVVFNPNQIKATDNEGLDKEYFKHINENEEKDIDTKESFDVESTTVNEKVITSFGGKVPISNKDKDQILKFCKKAVEDGMKPTKYTEEDMSNSANFSSGSIASNAPENTRKVINLGAEKIEEAFIVCSLNGEEVEGTYTTDLNKAKRMRSELADIYRTFFKIERVPDIPNFENTEELKESTEKGKTCVFTFGRYQPPTKGHLKVWEKVADTEGDAHYIYTSHTKDKKKNPLDYNTKVGLIESALKENSINAEIVESEAKTIIDVVVDIANKGFTDIIFVGGSDRLNDIVTLIQKYNDVPNKEGNSYHFDTIEGVSAGERDPDSDSLEGVSGTKIRQFALDNDFESFKNNLAFSDESTAKEVMEIIKANIKK